jgi:hypothetical protein
VKNSQRVIWYEAAYDKLRRDLLPEAPAVVTLTVGFPIKKRSGQSMTIGECAYGCMHDHGGEFGMENIITIHPVVGDDLVNALAVLAHEMIHHALEPGVGHKKPFQDIAKRIGLCKPWTATLPDGTLQKKLQGIVVELEEELGYLPRGYYVPPPPKEKKPVNKTKIRCQCAVPRELTIAAKFVDAGSILCGNCEKPFRLVRESDDLKV